LAMVHLYCSFKALCSVELRTLNLQRTSLLLDHFLADPHTVATPEMIAKEERVVGTPHYEKKLHIKLGVTIKELIGTTMTVEDLNKLASLFEEEKHLIGCSANTIYVVMRKGCDEQDTLRAYFNAYHLRTLLLQSADNSDITQQIEDSLDFTQRHYDPFVNLLEKNSWVTSHILFTLPKNKADW